MASKVLDNLPFLRMITKSPDRVSELLMTRIFGLIVTLLILTSIFGVSVWCRAGIGYQLFRNKLPLIEEKTFSKIERVKGRAMDPSELSTMCWLDSWFRSRTRSGKSSFLHSGRRVENYQVQSGQHSLELSLFVVEDRVYHAVLTASASSDELVKRWKAVLKEATPSLPLKVFVDTNRALAEASQLSAAGTNVDHQIIELVKDYFRSRGVQIPSKILIEQRNTNYWLVTVRKGQPSEMQFEVNPTTKQFLKVVGD